MTDRLAIAISELVEALREEARREAEAGPRTPDRLLSIPEAAEALSIGRSALYGLIGRGDLRSIKVGKSRRVPASAVDSYIAEAGR